MGIYRFAMEKRTFKWYELPREDVPQVTEETHYIFTVESGSKLEALRRAKLDYKKIVDTARRVKGREGRG